MWSDRFTWWSDRSTVHRELVLYFGTVIFIFFATIIALPVFIIQGNVDWVPAILLAIGLSAGGWVGAKFAVRGGEKWIRIVMIVAAVALALNLLGFWDWLI